MPVDFAKLAIAFAISFIGLWIYIVTSIIFFNDIPNTKTRWIPLLAGFFHLFLVLHHPGSGNQIGPWI